MSNLQMRNGALLRQHQNGNYGNTAFPPASNNAPSSQNSLSGGVGNNMNRAPIQGGGPEGGEVRMAPSSSSLGLVQNGRNRNAANTEDLQMLTPARGRLGIEEIPFGGSDPIPNVVVPPPPSGWGRQVALEDSLQRFENRNTNGIDGGGRSTNITRFTPQLLQYQQGDDASRFRMFERNNVSQIKTDQRTFV